MKHELTKSCWKALLLLSEAVRKFKEPIEFCSFGFGAGEDIAMNSLLDPHLDYFTVTVVLGHKHIDCSADKTQSLFRLNNFIHVSKIRSRPLPRHILQLVRIYLPYCFSSLYARKWKRAFAVSHLVQSLDGRIATPSGDSKWIGSHGNFVHAHRMRALSDGVLIGSRTLRRDKPQLTVRHVNGDNPIRIILGSTAEGIESLTQASPDPILLIGARNRTEGKSIRSLLLRRDNDFISTSLILKALFECGIYSVYIEGGAITASRFLKENNIDILQMHISPMIIGSGVNSFSLPPIQNISSSLRLKSHFFIPVDDAIMLIATLERPDQKGNFR